MGTRTRPARTRPIRFTLSVLLIIPLISLAALWGFAVSVTVGDEFAKRNYDTLTKAFSSSGTALAADVARERALSFAWLSSGGRMPRATLDAQRASTDTAIPVFRRHAVSGTAQGALGAAAKSDLTAMLGELSQLQAVRSAIDARTMTPLRAFQFYDAIMDAHFRFFTDMAALNDISIYRQGESNLGGARAGELVGREAALVGGAKAAGGRLSGPERGLFAQTVGGQRYIDSQLLAQPDRALREPYERLFTSPMYANFGAMEDRLITAGGGSRASLPVNPAAFEGDAQAVAASMQNSVLAGGAVVAGEANKLGNRILLRLGIVGGAGLAAVLVSIILSLRFGRRIARELTSLLVAALNLSEDRLPWVVDRLRRGEEVDVDAEAPPFASGRTAEIAKVARAFSTVQRTAVEAAVGQANLRRGVNRVFVNLARRSQSLLHRQLDMLDSMERATADPEELERFFRLDHLTTRMRRHAESLIILSGEPPGRGWRQPVPLVDVLRGAVAEVEDYVRVDVASDARDALVGTAVADVIHLLAELIENATAYSPPNTRVTVTADRVGNGFAVEIEDRGLGIDPAALAAINQRLAESAEFDLVNSDRLGLFVVSQLAARHQIKVSLRESPFGGTTAIVLIPHSAVVPAEQLADLSGDVAYDTTGSAGASWEPTGAGRAATGSRHDPMSAGHGPAGAGHEAAGAGHEAAGAGHEAAGAGYEAATSPAGAEPGDLASPPPAAMGNGRYRSPFATPASPLLAPAGASAQPDGIWAEPAGADGQDLGAPGRYLGLPRRIRQASLAPQLRDRPEAAGQAPPAPAAGTPQPRSPEEARARLSSMQRGWQLGRTDRPDVAVPGDARITRSDAAERGAEAAPRAGADDEEERP